MIPIRIKGDIRDYKSQINKLKTKIDDVIAKGYLGKRRRVTWETIESYHNNLDSSLRDKYLKKIGDGKGYDDYRSCEIECKVRSDILAPETMLSESTIRLLKCLKDNLKRITEAEVEKLREIIEEFQPKFSLDDKNNINRKSEEYGAVYKLFVDDTYDRSDFKDIVWKITGLKVCPYCNRTYIPFISVGNGEGEKSIKGQLDHFFPKDKYPYLAVSLYNLVPSCAYCNGPSGKHDKDPYDPSSELVSPFSLYDHKGICFILKEFDNGIFDLDRCADSIKLGVDVSNNPQMAINEDIFHLTDVYSYHKDIAAEIIMKYFHISSDKYIKFVKKILNPLNAHMSQKDLLMLYWGVPISEDMLGDRPMSKFTLDLITYLSKKKDEM